MNRLFSKEDIQMVNENLNFSKRQVNANQNHNEVSPHTY